MPGLGSESKLGLAKETTPSVGVVPVSAIPFTSANFTAPRTMLESETIGGSSMLKNAVPGDSESTGSVVQEFDAETSGILLDLWNGDNGRSVAAYTSGRISAAPTGSAGGSGATIPRGDYINKVAAIWEHDYLGKSFISFESAASSAITVALGEEVALSWTAPSGLTLADYTYKGTAIYRTAAGGAAATARFLAFVSGTGASFTDTGANANADTGVSSVGVVNLYRHVLKGAAAAANSDRIRYFSAQMSKNIGSDERYYGNKGNDFSLEIPDRASPVTLTLNCMGDDMESLLGEFSVAAPTPRRQILGRDTVVVIDGVRDCDIQQLSLTGTNNCSKLGTLCGNTITEGARRINGSITLLFRNHTLFNKAVSGTELSMQIYMAGEPVMTSGGTLSLATHGVDAVPWPRVAKFDMRRVTLAEFANPVEGPDQIIATASLAVMESPVTNTDLEIVLVNTISSYA
mgnify:CR=1 FL=1